MRITRAAGDTDPGRRRRRNEDAFVCEPPLFAVADGMGGAQAGELASALASEALREGTPGVGENRVTQLIQEANRRVFERASEDAAASGMGTTVTVALVDEEHGRILFGHVGDSRAYLIRDGAVEQLTDDHSLVAELVRSGKLSPEEADTHPQRSVITRALGTDPSVDVDAFVVEGRPGDLFLICSDGLSSMVSDQVILDVAERSRGDLREAVRALLAEANRGGGEDNITAVLFELGAGDGSGPPEETRERAVEDTAPEPDDEDTLSPLDGIRVEDVEAAAEGAWGNREVPPASDAAPGKPAEPVDTMVVPVDQIEEAAQPPVRDSGPVEGVWGDREAPPAGDVAYEPEPEPHVPLWRRLLALVVILVLVAMIIALVVWGLAR